MLRVLVGLRWLTRKPEELLALSMSMVEQLAKELRVDAARGAKSAKDGGQRRDVTIVIVIMQILAHFFLAANNHRRVGPQARWNDRVSQEKLKEKGAGR